MVRWKARLPVRSLLLLALLAASSLDTALAKKACGTLDLESPVRLSTYLWVCVHACVPLLVWPCWPCCPKPGVKRSLAA